MKALSIQQPWAWMIVNGYKDVENRDWPTRRKGERVAVHAGKKIDQQAVTWLHECAAEILPYGAPIPESFDTGGIVGTIVITGCVESSPSKWFEGRYGFTLANPTRCSLIPLRGQLGFFDVPEEIATDSPASPSAKASLDNSDTPSAFIPREKR